MKFTKKIITSTTGFFIKSKEEEDFFIKEMKRLKIQMCSTNVRDNDVIAYFPHNRVTFVQYSNYVNKEISETYIRNWCKNNNYKLLEFSDFMNKSEELIYEIY